MKKRYFFIALAIIALMISGILVINKKSYAEKDYLADYCAYEIAPSLDSYGTELSYIRNGANKITLPSTRIAYDYKRPVFYNNIFVMNGETLQYKVEFVYDDSFYNRNFSYSTDAYYYDDSYQKSILMGYLIRDTYFDKDEKKDNYFKQLLVLWAMDRLVGFKDDINYAYGEDYNIYEVDKDEKYEDKYDIHFLDGNSYDKNIYYWNYVNNLSAGDKEMLKESEYGNKMLSYLDTWEDYVNWYINHNNKVEFDSLTQDDISYHVTNNYVETGLIMPQSTGKIYSDKFSGYTVKVETPMTVVNKEGVEQTEFDAGESFRIRMPISEIKNKTLNYSIQINGNFDFDTINLYVPCNHIAMRYETPSTERIWLYQQLLNSVLFQGCNTTETLNADLSLEFTQQVGNLDIRVIDSSTGDNLSKAEVTVYDLKGNEVYKYETTDKELNITLPVGEYIVKQTVTPPNYEAQTIQMRVDVTEDGTANAVLENAPFVDVPDTAMNSVIFMVIGGLVVIAGGILFFANLIKRKVN